MLKQGNKIAIVVNSNGIDKKQKNEIDYLIKILENFGLKIEYSPYIYKQENVFSGTAQQKADALMKFYKDKDIKAIFDISGGDLANSVIDFLDYNEIIHNNKPLFGYSDLTCLMNAIYAKTGQINVLYQIRNLINNHQQQTNFYNSLFLNQNDLYDFNYQFIQGNELSGIVVGGNIRCLLKLAGTSYFPNMKDKVLFLESLGGRLPLIYSHFVHLQQLNVFKDIKGLILGTFTVMQENNESVIEIAKMFSDKPIIKTEWIGHSNHSKAIRIGEYIELRNK